MPQHLYTLVVCILLLAGCKNTQQKIANSAKNDKIEQKSATNKFSLAKPKQIPPQYCRLIGMIVEVEKIVDKQTRGCKIGPCYAMIKIEQVLGYGSSFPSNFQSGAEITVFFPSSLNSTDHLPGLKKGDSFKADMEGAITLSNQPTYTIYSYELE